MQTNTKAQRNGQGYGYRFKTTVDVRTMEHMRSAVPLIKINMRLLICSRQNGRKKKEEVEGLQVQKPANEQL